MAEIYKPIFSITPKITTDLMRIEGAKREILLLPITTMALKHLRESARIASTHFSTKIEGNNLTQDQVRELLTKEGRFPGRQRDEREVRGYYEALEFVERSAIRSVQITEKFIKTLHALLMAEGRTKATPTEYRTGQNVIRDGATGSIVYLPPEPHDVPNLMSAFVDWIHSQQELPVPIISAIAHYQLVTIHPYYDGNGRLSRLLATMILHSGGYDLNGIYCLEEYYANNLGAYYDALTIGESHNYYFGRATGDITKWVEYFIAGMAEATEKVRIRATQAASAWDGNTDSAATRRLIRELNPKQRIVLTLFSEFKEITTKQVAEALGYRPRTARDLCQKWVSAGFLVVGETSKRTRTYRLNDKYEDLVQGVS